MSELYTLIKIAAISGVLLGWYLLFLRNRRMHRYNRFFLVAIIALSVALPTLDIPIALQGNAENNTISRAVTIINSSGDEVADVVKTSSGFGMADICSMLYVAIAVILLLRPAMQILRLYQIKRRSSTYVLSGATIIPCDLSHAPFSFFGNVYWNNSTDINSPAGQRILKHELVHIHQKHTWDKLFVQAACAVCWPVPFFWLIKKELAVVHEFLADESSIENNDTASLAEMLLHSAVGYSPAITNTFYSSPIKRRILMLTKTNSRRYRTVRALSVLPLAAAVLLTSFRFIPKTTTANHKITVVFDAGHGGNDAGGMHNGIAEKDLNLKIVNKLTSLAGEYNVGVVTTRAGDNYPTLSQRVEMSNATKADAFVSIHVNQEAKDNKIAGDYLVYVSQGNRQYGQSTKLATAIANSMSTYKPQVVNKGLAVLKGNDHPAVLIECGNIDKEEQLALLQNDSKLDELCRKILTGIVNFKN